MSRAAREPLRGDELSPLPAVALAVREAEPSPRRGPERDRLAALAESRVRRNEAAVVAVVDEYLDRVLGVVEARLQGPRARKNTRWWSDRVSVEEKRGGMGVIATYTPTYEVKALEPEYVLPAKTVREIGGKIRPVGISIVAGSVADTARRLGRRDVGLAVFDQQAVDKAVEDAVRRMLGVADRHAQEIRKAITDADATARSLDEVLDRVREAHRRGGNWVRLAGRNLAIALGNDASLASARALGVTHVQWLSRRDDHVRATHRIADGQVRRVGDRFEVGRFLLRFPADPTDLPDSWGEVGNCRCGILVAPPDAAKTEIMRLARVGTPAVAREVARAALEAGVPADENPVTTLPGLLAVTAHRLAAPLAAYRSFDTAPDMVAGQLFALGTSTAVLALAAPTVPAALTLTVVFPAGYTVAASGAVVLLPAATPLEVVSMTSTGIVAQPVA